MRISIATLVLATFGLILPQFAVARAYGDCRKIGHLMLGDYYPLRPYNLQNDRWIAWQFDRPEQGDGMVQAFRRNESLYESARLELHGLEPNAIYRLTNLDIAGTTEAAGRELIERGLSIVMRDRPGSAVITYKKMPTREHHP